MLKCSKCGAVWPDNYPQTWGTAEAPETMGYGPTPKCVNIVVNPRTKAGEVCGGQVAPGAARPRQHE